MTNKIKGRLRKTKATPKLVTSVYFDYKDYVLFKNMCVSLKVSSNTVIRDMVKLFIVKNKTKVKPSKVYSPKVYLETVSGKKSYVE